MTTPSILFVCLGNICRSPAAEAVTRALAPHLTIDSCGTGPWHVGEPPYAPMQKAALARGIDMSDLRARQFTAADFDRFDLIICMDDANMSEVERQRPAGNTTPVRLFADGPVPDPYYTRDFDGCLDMIESAATALVSCT